MDFQLWAAFVAASAAVLAVPGPNVLLVVTCSLARGPRAVWPLACGVALGDLTAMVGSFAGLGALVLVHPSLFAGLRWAGAAYLAWLGVGLWRQARGELRSAEARTGAARLVAQGWLSVMLNPLTIGFFVAFLPQFVDRARPLWPQAAALGATFLLMAFATSLAYGFGAARMGRAAARPGFAAPLHRVGGAALIGTAAWLVLRAGWGVTEA